MAGNTADARHVHQLWRAYRRFRQMPRPLRRPRTLARAAAIGACLWFASLFGALGLSADQPTAATVGFVAACTAGICGALSVAKRHYRLGGLLGAGMLVVGQLATVALLI